MGLLDELTSHLTNATGSAPHPGLLQAAMNMLNNQQQGGLAGLVQHLSANGLQGAVASWVGTGPNQSVSPDQMASALGQDRLNQMAQQAGLSPQQASAGLASILPHLIDKLTPGGQMPSGNLLQQGLSMLGKLTGH